MSTYEEGEAVGISKQEREREEKGKILAESVAFTLVWRVGVGVGTRDLDPRGREIRRLNLLPRKTPNATPEFF